MNEIAKRVKATAATEKRFRDKPFDWAKNATCIHMMRYHAAKMGRQMPIVPRFRSAIGAKKKLLGMGYASVIEVMDEHFERIPPAFMRVGDMLALPGDEHFEALVIKGDRHKFLGWHETAPGCTIMEVDITQALGSWRV